MDPRAARRRDRRGRGIRGPMAPEIVPSSVTRATQFTALAVAALDRLHPVWRPLLPALVIEVHEVPPDSADAREDEVPLAAHRSGHADGVPTIVVYRRPVELRALDRPTRVDLLRSLVAEQLAEILGRDPGDLDPAYRHPR